MRQIDFILTGSISLSVSLENLGLLSFSPQYSFEKMMNMQCLQPVGGDERVAREIHLLLVPSIHFTQTVSAVIKFVVMYADHDHF